MMPFDPILAPGAHTIALRLARPDAVPEALDPTGRRWAEATGFKPRAGAALAIPDAEGGLHGALMVVPDQPGCWDLGMAPRVLPSGTYHLADPVSPERFEAWALGWMLGSYRFDRYRTDDHGPRAQLAAPPGHSIEAVIGQAEAICRVRDLINIPANDLGPAELSEATRQLAERHGARHDEVVGDDLLAHGFPAIHAVGRASPRAPRLITLRWGEEDAPAVVLVGKGVVFDTGGLDLKPSRAMALMKKDMGGAAHVLGLAGMIMQAGLKIRLRVIIPAVENAVSGNAFRPGDVIATRKGLRVAIGNTDAEGRVILADALALAMESPPEVLLDFATLTGAARVALGPEIAPLMTPDDALAEALMQHGRALDDPIWRLPLWPGYKADIDSPIADIDNAGESGFAGAITAGLFLERFVEPAKNPGTAWAHFDVYGWNPKDRPGRPKGGEAFALRACFAWLQDRYG